IVKKFSSFLPFVFLVVLLAGCNCPLCSGDEKGAPAEEVTKVAPAEGRSEIGDVIKVSSVEDFEKYKKDSKNLVIKFFAAWCGPCKTLTPIYVEVAKGFVSEVAFLSVDVGDSEGQKIAAQYGVQAIPHVVWLKDGEKVDEQMGLASRGTYESKTRKVFGL
ncbi:thioredoxin family protein, partial [Candidatus Babeliales bacterium]|nr:thioredoxin family protein [Candidatus Babeliales bacterium]